MKKTLIYCAVWTIAFVYFGTITAAEKIDVSKVITKSDAEAGRDAPPHLAQTMFSVLPAGGGKSTKVNGIGDKAIFYHDKSGLEMMNILKGEVFLTIGIHGMPAQAALEQEKSIAKKILAKL